MALIEPIIGHLLSKYQQTVEEGLQKIEVHLKQDGAEFANLFAAQSHAVSALILSSQRTPAVLEQSFSIVKHIISLSSQSSRLMIARTITTKETFPMFSTALSSVTEANVNVCLQALGLLAAIAIHCPQVILSRFGGQVPLHFACFRPQLPFGLRRLRNARLVLLANLASSKYPRTTTEVICTHGFLTQLLEDTAEILRQDEGDSMKVVSEVLDVVQYRFISDTSTIDKETRKQLLVGQRNIFRILIKALSVEAIADRCASMLYQLVDGVMESSSDYALSRTEADDKGMPNFLVFTILRTLHPKNTAREAALVCYILNKCPDLIRPYFVRVSSHLAEDTGVRGSSSNNPVNNIAVLNVLTRSMLAPLPFHLQGSVARLQPSSASAQRFFSLSPKNAAEEVCPPWLGQFIHKRINNSNNLAMLVWALQVAQSAVNRAMHVHKLIHAIHAAQSKQLEEHRKLGSLTSDVADFLAVDMEQYDAEFLAALETFLPKREEFWHRMSQQLHKPFTEPSTPASGEAGNAKAALLREKTLFAVERMNLLMDSYTTLFRLRVSWLSAAPELHPRIVENKKGGWTGVMTQLMQTQGSSDGLALWTPKSVATLCNLLCSSLARGVQIPRLHHVNTGNALSTLPRSQSIADWPLLVSLLSWYCANRRAEAEEDISNDTQEALGYIARLVLLCVHSVSVRYAAELDEVYLWLSELQPKFIPMFLHVIGIMMVRSTSKTAEKIAATLTNAEYGVLVESATVLIQKSREKATTQDPKKAAGGNVWQVNIEENLKPFEDFVDTIKQMWSKRQKLLRRGLTRAANANATIAMRGRKQLTVAVLAATTHTHTSSLVDVLQDVCNSHSDSLLSSSLVPLKSDSDDATIARIEAAGTFVELCKLLVPSSKKKSNSDDWTKSKVAPWCVLRRIAALNDSDKMTTSTIESVLRHVSSVGATEDGLSADAQHTTRFVQSSHALSPIDGVLACVLLLLQRALKVSYIGRTDAPLKVIADDVIDRLGQLTLRTYAGTLSASDRLRYAVLLHLHYVQHPHAIQKADAITNEADVMLGSSDSDAGSDSETDQSLSTTPRQRPADVGAVPAESRKRFRSSNNARGAKKGQGVVLQSCVVPSQIQRGRYVTEGAALAPNTTREIDVLTQLLDSWTEMDARRLTGPLTLTNHVYIRTSSEHDSSVSGKQLASMWRAIFPDVLSARDQLVVDIRAATHRLDMDPRYLLPLVNTVAAISAAHPELVPPHLLSRMFSFSVRALSFTCPALRQLASNILALSAKHLTPQRRSLLNYARLRTLKWELQLAKRGKTSSSADRSVPRLPASVTAFMVAAQTPLHRYDHHLHNDVVNFLSGVPSSFSSNFPLDHLLTSFPLGCLTHSLMVQKQDELVRGPRAAPQNGSTGASASKKTGGNRVLDEGGNMLQAALEKEAPVHLQFIFGMLSSSSGALADARALIRSGVISNTLSLITMLSSHPNLRVQALDVVTRVCSHSADVASTLAVEGQVLSWAHSFALHVTEEFSDRVDELSGPLLQHVLQLTLRLLQSLPRSSGRHSFIQDRISRGAVDALRRRLQHLNVSSKNLWEQVESLESVLRDK